MIKEILFRNGHSLKSRVKKCLFYCSVRRGVRVGWKRRFKRIFQVHPDYRARAEKEMEEKHKKYWSTFSRNININTLRVSKNISGVSDLKYIPEEIFATDIEPTLNRTPAVEFLSYKSFYERWLPGCNFPKCFFHNVDGEWLDEELNPINFDNVKEIVKILTYPVVFKPNRDSTGGKGLFFPACFEELLDHIENKRDFVVQERIYQHPFFDKFNSAGLNTIRVCLYRSVSDNKIHILNCTLRMGVGGSLDNETAGGIVCLIDESGILTGTARDKYGKNFGFHPDSKLPFTEAIPCFPELSATSIMIARKLFYCRLISLDFCLDLNKIWRPIEVNLFGQTIRFAQYAGRPFFGSLTDEIVWYCKKNHWSLR